jgi:hypothetical protein
MITVIGSGFGAFGIVKKLVDKSIRVRVITSTVSRQINDIGAVPLNMPIVQTSGLGGTSKIWGGGFAPFEEDDFNNWPIDYDDLCPYYNEVSSFFNFDFAKFETRNQDESIKSQIDHVIFDKFKFINKWFLIPLPIIRLKDYYEKWEKEGKIEIIYDDIVKINTTDKTALSAIKSYKYSKIIIAAGCLNSSYILYNSGVKNASIGRYLSDHPKLYFASLKIKNPMPKNSVYAFMKYKDNSGVQVKTGLILKSPKKYGNHNFYLKPLFRDIETTKKIEALGTLIYTLQKDVLKPKNLIHLLSNFKTLVQGAVYKFNLFQKYSQVGLFGILENRPFAESKLDLSRPGTVDYTIADNEIIDYLDFFRDVSNSFGESCSLLVDSRDKFLNNVSSAAHFTGTTRMVDQCSEGVVDKDLAVFNVSDIYVCDGGVFPSNGNANISMTILALSLRLGDHLIKEGI